LINLLGWWQLYVELIGLHYWRGGGGRIWHTLSIDSLGFRQGKKKVCFDFDPDARGKSTTHLLFMTHAIDQRVSILK
jgi:hypothetical protein